MRPNALLLTAMAVLVLTGCGSSTAPTGGGGVLNSLIDYPDTNSNGFPDVPPPEGVETEETIAIRFSNQITMDQAEQLAEVSLPQFVEDSVSVRAELAVYLTYPNGVTDALTGSRSIAEFELLAEVACPESVEVRTTVVAYVPVVGRQPISTFGPYFFERGTAGGYECGSVIGVDVYVNDAGEAVAEYLIEPMEDDDEQP